MNGVKGRASMRVNGRDGNGSSASFIGVEWFAMPFGMPLWARDDLVAMISRFAHFEVPVIVVRRCEAQSEKPLFDIPGSEAPSKAMQRRQQVARNEIRANERKI